MKDRVLYNSPERIMQPWGNGSHKGIDLGRISSYTWAQNYEVYANCVGVVAEIQTGIPNDKNATGVRSWGNYVYIKHPNGMYSRYAHLRDVYVKKGQKVDENTKIGIMGDSGKAFGAHLHFEVSTGYSSNSRINPTPYLTKAIYDGSNHNHEQSSKPVGITGDITYQSYDNVKKQWLPQVVNDKDYAGNLGNGLGGFRAKPKYGKIYMQSHIRNGEWLDVVDSTHYIENSLEGDTYSGLFGMQIDGVKIWSSQGFVSYRVHILGGDWLPWVNKADNTPDGYAGIYGMTIDGIQMF